MGYTELCNAVVLQAVTDYVKMLRYCKHHNVYDPNKYMRDHYRKDRNNSRNHSSPFNIIKNGLDAKYFLEDEDRLSFYTNCSSKSLIKMAEDKANDILDAKSTSHLMNKKKLIDS